MNSTVNNATGYIPTYLFIAFIPQTATLFNKFPAEPADILQHDNEGILDGEKQKREAFQEVHKLLKERAERNEVYHDSKGTQQKRELGDQVLLRNQTVPTYEN